ncbi:hypothetical protein [Aquimarina sp. MMG016]|uniref:hypothetical protein n=1 Tax=Aquimarina sp. MMG016 TaxID=2822690 RepID=UPI001B39DD94|nr:hypothetical protein [Aquimarina sp. MMG016]MBQ4820281.1 hypothetical protein [Aquimarina sp. MMG016]
MKACFNCGKNGNDLLYSYSICDSCKAKLRLFKNHTIEKHNAKNPEKFSNEIQRRLDFLDKDYIKKRIKLLHIQEQLKNLESK